MACAFPASEQRRKFRFSRINARKDSESIKVNWLFAWSDDKPSGMQVFDAILSDRGSKYAVSGGVVNSRAAATDFIKTLRRDRKFARATHNSWGVLLPDGPLKNDDGESGAGMVILRMLEREGLEGHIIVVTRWYGGKKLGGDRFRRVQDAVRYYLDNRTQTS